MQSWEVQAVTAQSARAFAFATKVRLGAVLIFLPLIVWLTAVEAPGWAPYLAPLVAYAVVAATFFTFRKTARVQRVGDFSFILDAGFIYFLQHQSMSTSQFPAGVAGFSLGMFTLFVLLAGVSMRPRATLTTALASMPLQLALMQQAGVGVGAQVAAIIVLTCAGLSQAAFLRRLVTMVRSAASLEVAHRFETERAVKLEQANATINALYADAEKRNAELVRLQADKDLLTSLLVHDLRAPLSAVKANLAWLEDEVAVLKDEDVTAAVTESQQVAQRLTGMIGDLLNITKLESNALTLNHEPVLARPLLNSLAKQVTAQARARKVTVLVEASDISFDADQALLLRVIENLTSNALRYTPPAGRVQLEAKADKDTVLLAVRNDGTPIPAEARATLFDKFVQAGDTQENRRVGWGLGLYFCQLSVASHGGTIAVEDVPGWPTSFVIRLPRLHAPVSKAA